MKSRKFIIILLTGSTIAIALYLLAWSLGFATFSTTFSRPRTIPEAASSITSHTVTPSNSSDISATPPPRQLRRSVGAAPSLPRTLAPSGAAPPAVGNPADLIDAELEKLPVGQVYHNVSNEMQVGVQETIEAGMAPTITEQIRREIQGKGEVTVKSGVPFNPSGVEMHLVVNPEEFKVLEVRGGKQFVTSKIPGKWIWEITPLKPGEHLLVVKATVDLEVPTLNATRPIEVEVFRDKRTVKVNWGYTVGQFVAANWKEILGVIVGSGSLVGLISWGLGQYKEKTKAGEARKKQKLVGQGKR